MKSERSSFPRSAQASHHRTPGRSSHDNLAGRQSLQAIDLEQLLHFSQQLYAHALTLQEVIRTEGKVTYEVLRPRYDRQAAQQFGVFHHPSKPPLGVREPSSGLVGSGLNRQA